MFRKFLIAAAVAVAVPATSQAVFFVSLTPGVGTPVTVFDNLEPFPSTPGYADGEPGIIPVPGGSTRIIRPTQGGSGIITVGSFQIAMQASRTEATTFSQVVDSVLAITNSSTTAQTIVINVTESAFALPGGPGSDLTFTSSLSFVNLSREGGGALVDGGLATISSRSELDDAGPGGPAVIAQGGGPFTGIQATPPGAAFAQTSGPLIFTRSAAPAGNTFSLSNFATVTLAPGATLVFQASAQVTGQPVPPGVIPAPMGLIAAATALPFVGLLRRRLRRTTTA